MESKKPHKNLEYSNNNQKYNISILEIDKDILEIYCRKEKEKDYYFIKENFAKNYNYIDSFNDIITLFERKKIKIKDNKGNQEIEIIFPKEFRSQKININPKDDFIKKDDFVFNVYKEKDKDIYSIVIIKNNQTYPFDLKINDLELIGFGKEVNEIIDDIKKIEKENIEFFVKGNIGFLHIMNKQKITLKNLDYIRALNIMEDSFDENPIFNHEFSIAKIINDLNYENIKKQKRMEKLIKEMKEKQNEISNTNPRLSKNIKIMKDNADLMCFPKKRTPVDKDPGVEFDSYIIGKKKDFDLINNKLTQVYNREKVKYEIIYRASQDRDLAKIFKEKCKNVRGTLIIVKTDSIENKRIFGGFTTQEWDDSERNYDDDKAFCFSVNEHKIYDLRPYCSAIGCDKGSGPRFCWMFEINNKFMMEGGKVYREEVSHYSGQDKDYELNGGEEFFIVYELEVFKITPQ